MPAPSLAALELDPLLPERPVVERLEALATENFQFIWRSLRRLGVPPAGVDDAAQQVFEVASSRI